MYMLKVMRRCRLKNKKYTPKKCFIKNIIRNIYLILSINLRRKKMAEYKILVVDDEEPIANILEFNLKKEGYDVIVANDGEKAVELAFNDNQI